MDPIEKMRRLNELTKELKQHGFVESSLEAIQQANQIYGDDALTRDVMHGIIKNPSDKSDTMETTDMINMDKKIAKMCENVELLTGKINEIVKALNDMDSRLNTLAKQKVERIVVEKPVERPADVPAGSVMDRQDVHEEVRAAVNENEAKEEYTNQRVGNYQPKDVAIDKMFYFGKK